ncbi:MAG: hypothetical protein QM654_07495 [Dysgonamonadaceae bacterium]
MTFEELRAKISQKFDFEIALSSPYKLCDYKPAYGYILEEYLNDYLFWGHCDVDTLMGNLSMFISDQLLNKYDKIFSLGHMVLYRNTYENNRIFMSSYKGIQLYKKVYSDDAICWFDEEFKDQYNINRLFIESGKRVFTEDLSLNFRATKFRFVRCKYVGIISVQSPRGYITENYRKAIYIWSKGSIYRLMKDEQKQIKKEEFLYMHLQARKMKFSEDILNYETVKIIPNTFTKLDIQNIDITNFDKIKVFESLPFYRYCLFKFIRKCIPLNLKCILKKWIIKK